MKAAALRGALSDRARANQVHVVSGLVDAFKGGRLPNSLNDPRYFNIKMMQNISLK